MSLLETNEGIVAERATPGEIERDRSPRGGIDPVAERLRRVIDVVVAVVLLVVLGPLIGLVALVIRLDSRGPALHVQLRAGRGGRAFRMYKLRSMVHDAEQRRDQLCGDNQQDGVLFKMRADPRVTRFGRWLRKSSLDELPQLVNVLRGEMTLVGPRPLPMRDLADLSQEHAEWAETRQQVLPGLTGLWQVEGRADASFEEMVRHDLQYVRTRRLTLDLWILWRTVPAILRGRGAY